MKKLIPLLRRVRTINIQKIAVSDLGEAKNYLGDTLGISRITCSLSTILEVAKANNIEFVGLDK